MATQEKNGSSVMPAEISGVWVDLHPIPKGVAVDRRGARLLLERKLGIKPRQQRATVSSYSVEGWAYQGADGARFFGVSSLDNGCWSTSIGASIPGSKTGERGGDRAGRHGT